MKSFESQPPGPVPEAKTGKEQVAAVPETLNNKIKPFKQRRAHKK